MELKCCLFFWGSWQELFAHNLSKDSGDMTWCRLTPDYTHQPVRCWKVLLTQNCLTKYQQWIKLKGRCEVKFEVFRLYEILWSHSVMSIVNLCSLLSARTSCYKMQEQLTRNIMNSVFDWVSYACRSFVVCRAEVIIPPTWRVGRPVMKHDEHVGQSSKVICNLDSWCSGPDQESFRICR